MTMITHTNGSYPSTLQGVITFSGTPTAFSPGETVTGSGFSAKVVKYDPTAKKLTVKKIVGNPTGALTGSISGTGTVATITSVTVGGISAYVGGWNLRETPNGVVRSKVVGARNIVEVMVSQSNLSTTRGDFAIPVSFSLTGGAWSTPTTYDVSNGDVITFTIISSEPTSLPEGTNYPFTITGVGAKSAVLTGSSSDSLVHTFSYPVTSGDVAGTALTIAATNFNLNGGEAHEIAADGSRKKLTTPVAVTGTLASKTGLTIQA